jgi:creatinine amidohydrolase
MVYELANMPWWEAKEKFGKTNVVLFPVGATEQHGLHLGLGADWIQAWNIAKRVGEKIDCIVLPVLPYGISKHHKDFPGTIYLESSTYIKVISDILKVLNDYGITRVVFMNGHGGNMRGLSEAAREAREKYGMLCAVCQWWDILYKYPILGQPAETHAGYAETSFMLASRPEAVKMELAMLTPTTQVDEEIQLISLGSARFRNGRFRMSLKTADVSVSGSMTEAHPEDVPGTTDFSKITPELANELMDKVVNWMCEFVKYFEKFELPPINVSKENALKELNK